MASPAEIMQNEAASLLNNLFMMRSELMSRFGGDDRDIDRECHYPPLIRPDEYTNRYARDGIAARANDIYPEECWKVDPEVYEKEEGAETEFDKAFDNLCKRINLWDFLERVDKMSGVNTYGVIFLGFDDGNALDQPVPGVSEDGTYNPPADVKRRLLYMRVFDERQAPVAAWQTQQGNARYGQPTFYNITFTDVNAATVSSVAASSPTTKSEKVHWSRIIHICDNRTSSEVIGTPRNQTIFNFLLNLAKILGASGEGYWKGGFPGLSIETHPGDENAEIDEESTRKMMFDYMNNLQRYLALSGTTAKTLAPEVLDPEPFFSTQIEAICITKAIPKRIFTGSERGELASSQDVKSWNDRLMRRMKRYLTPFVVRPTVDRLIGVGCLPIPNPAEAIRLTEEATSAILAFAYECEWPDLNSLSDAELATRAKDLTAAIVQYVTGDGASLMEPLDFLTRVLGLEQDEAEAVLKATADSIAQTTDPTNPEAQIGRSSTIPSPADLAAANDATPPSAMKQPQGFPPK